MMSLLTSLLFLSAAPTEASAPAQKSAAASEAKQAQRAARLARRHAKLDPQLNDAAEDAINAESSVIIEFNDESDAVNIVKGHGGKAGRRLGILNARVARISNEGAF